MDIKVGPARALKNILRRLENAQYENILSKEILQITLLINDCTETCSISTDSKLNFNLSLCFSTSLKRSEFLNLGLTKSIKVYEKRVKS